MLKKFTLSTESRSQIIDITRQIQSFINESGVEEGLAVVYSPHTTAGITINESADPDVKTDMLRHLGKLVPMDGGFHHAEGNSDSHIKTTMVNPSQTIIVSGGKLLFGTWQSIYFCEFDGPRRRTFYVKVFNG